MTLPLSPYTVIDLTRARSGPTCVRQLADMGARVVQISAREDVEGDFPRRGSDSQNLHRNKRSLTLDLKSPRGVEIIHKVVQNAPDTGEHSDQILAELGYSPVDIASLRNDKVI